MGTLPDINRICGIIDLCGSQVKNHFYVRELAMVSSTRNKHRPIARFFDYHPFGMDIFLPKRTLRYMSEVHDIMQLDNQLREIYDTLKSPGKDLMAFKGGQVEKEKLTSLNIPHVNLEEYGCAKFDLIKKREHIRLGCPYHKHKKVHCPRSEVMTFKSWLLEKIDQMQ